VLPESRICLDEAAAARSAQSLERRRFVRAGVDRPAWIHAQDHDLGGRCLNLSVGGALIKFTVSPILPGGVLLRISLATLDQTPAPIVARVIEVHGFRVRIAFDPLPKALARAISREVLAALGLASGKPLPS
jgi:hypothetical protein